LVKKQTGFISPKGIESPSRQGKGLKKLGRSTTQDAVPSQPTEPDDLLDLVDEEKNSISDSNEN